MINKNYLNLIYSLSIGFICFGLISCQTGVESSPDPGTLRVILQSNPADTSIIIINDTLTISKYDNFRTIVFQGKAYSDTNFAILYPTIHSYRQEDDTLNIIYRENNTYKPYKIFESYLPPGNYTSIAFGLTANLLHINLFDIPVELPPDSPKVVTLPVNFQISQSGVTEIDVQLSPFKSVTRYRDSYYFNRQLKITAVKYF
jgi:hypothetical protein